MSKKVRWGVLGAGGIADRRTLPGMMLAENAELIAVMEIDADFAERLRAKYNAKRAYTSDEELLKDPEIDAVYIDEVGMTVAFSPYELACYAAGTQIFRMTYEWLRPHLSEYGCGALELE